MGNKKSEYSKELLSKKSFWLILSLLIVLFIGLLFGKDMYRGIESKVYLNKNDITQEVQNNTLSYQLKEQSEYIVYFYNKTNCKECVDYSLEIKDFESDKKFTVYKVDVSKLDKEVVESELFIDSKNSYLVVIKDGTEDYRYIGNYPTESIEIK